MGRLRTHSVTLNEILTLVKRKKSARQFVGKLRNNNTQRNQNVKCIDQHFSLRKSLMSGEVNCGETKKQRKKKIGNRFDCPLSEKKIQNTQEMKRTLFIWTKQDKNCFETWRRRTGRKEYLIHPVLE